MRIVRRGDRGPAVEDIQRRLRTLGFNLGPGGVDGYFEGATAKAVAEFQRAHRLAEDGLVGDETWSALVDATFTFGDRMLYLRLPHFHGHDVRVLQEALNVLGFACGVPDGIFGAFAERAAREFQRNAGLTADGIVGAETVAALNSLRHVWEGKDPKAHSAARTGMARAAEVLSRLAFAVGGLDPDGERVAGRLVNLALATTSDARIRLLGIEEGAPAGMSVVLRICGHGTAVGRPGRPVVRIDAAEALAPRLLTAVSTARRECPEVVVELGGTGAEDERAEQRSAVNLLDAVCAVFD